MKTIFALLILISTTAQANQAECVSALQAFNKRAPEKMEYVFLDFGTSGDQLFFRTKPGTSRTNEEQAAGYDAVRKCLQAGFSNSLWIGDIGNDKPKNLCVINSSKTLAAVCNPPKIEGNWTAKVVRLK